MRKMFLFCFVLIGCAPIIHNSVKVMDSVSQCQAQKNYLATVKVTFVAGMPFCPGEMQTEGGRFVYRPYALGCYHSSDNSIEVATVNWDKPGYSLDGEGKVGRDFISPWLYEDEVEETLAHEYVHALQYWSAGKTWHPADIESLPTKWCKP